MSSPITWVRGDSPLPLKVNTNLASTTVTAFATDLTNPSLGAQALSVQVVNAATGDISVSGAVLAAVGVYALEVQVTQGSTVSTFPNDGQQVLTVIADAGAVASGASELDGLLESLPGYELLTTNMKQRALTGAQVPDSFGIWPGQVGYERTYDVYWAAISLIGFLQAQPVVRQASSEGTSVAVDSPNWGGLVAWYRSMSPINSATGQGVLNELFIPGEPHVFKLDMRRGANGYDNVDTDLG